MKTKGIRISDIKEGKCITFSEILSYIKGLSKNNLNISRYIVT
jgi:hypothetical protein